MLGKIVGNSASRFWRALRSDTAGNVYAMAAAALFPIAAIIGGGVDIGRAYMAQARLQQACDAGALAGRRAMTGATMSTADAVEARKFFDFNFPEGSFDTDPFTKVDGKNNPRFVDGPGDKSVRVYHPPGKFTRNVSPTIPSSIDKADVAANGLTLTPRCPLAPPVSQPTIQPAMSAQLPTTQLPNPVISPPVDPPPVTAIPA